MIRMEIALFFVLSFIAFFYFSAERNRTVLHRTFAALIVAMLVNIVFDGITVFTVSNLDLVPKWFNDTAHRIFIGSMTFVVFLFYEYIAELVSEEAGCVRRFTAVPRAMLAVFELCALLLPIHIAQTPAGNYSDGIHVTVCFISIFFYYILCVGMLAGNWKRIDRKKRTAISVALLIEITVTLLQGVYKTWLLSGMGLTLMTLAFYLVLENPEILRAELVEQKLSMLYLKSQVNPHFLYNTLDTIRIQARLNGDTEVSGLLMRLVDFFRLSVKVDHQMVELDDELELLDAYMDLMCHRYPSIIYECDVDPDLGSAMVPNFILQPVVENSLLHGLKNKGYRGTVRISAFRSGEDDIDIEVYDNGSGFEDGKKKAVDEMLRTYEKQAPRLEGNSIGILNVQKRIKYLCGTRYGLSYTDNPEGGVTAHLRLPLERGEY